jgi:hypothetical protein
VAIRSQSGGCACVHETGWLSPLQMAKRAQSGRREEMKGGTQRRMAMAFRWVRLERPLCSAWTRRVRFPGVRALGGSSARRLGGLTGRQLTGPVAEAPEVDLRRSARSDHETELAARSPGGADANSSFSTTQVSVKKSYSKKTRPRPRVSPSPKQVRATPALARRSRASARMQSGRWANINCKSYDHEKSDLIYQTILTMPPLGAW